MLAVSTDFGPGVLRGLLGSAAHVLALTVFVAGGAVSAQEYGRVTGVVVDSITNIPVASVVVQIATLEKSVTSDSSGRYEVMRVPAGEHILVFEAMGYANKHVRVRAFAGETAHATVFLQPIPVPHTSLEVSTTAGASGAELGGFWDRQRRGDGFFLTRQQIDARGGQRLVDLISRAPGARIVRIDAIGGGHIVVFRGTSTLCPPVVYLDGLVFPMNESGLDVLRPDEIEAVEAYSGPARLPAQFNRTGQGASRPGQLTSSPHCGVIVLWTRRGGAGR
jgi:hypothetical protein